VVYKNDSLLEAINYAFKREFKMFVLYYNNGACHACKGQRIE